MAGASKNKNRSKACVLQNRWGSGVLCWSTSNHGERCALVRIGFSVLKKGFCGIKMCEDLEFYVLAVRIVC